MLNGFKEYISKKGSVKAQYIPLYLKWVAACYSFLGVPDSTRIDRDRKKQFLSHMAKTHEDWQVKQADAALRLYQYFLSQSEKGIRHSIHSYFCSACS